MTLRGTSTASSCPGRNGVVCPSFSRLPWATGKSMLSWQLTANASSAGDLGVGGMGIPIGKLALCTAAGGIDPSRSSMVSTIACASP